MSPSAIDALKAWKGEHVDDRLMRPAAGLEVEFTLFVDDRQVRPEHVFGDPRGFVSAHMMHRTGRSFHLPNGAAIYFDTGVIELASPAIELEAGCFGRLARLMEIAIAFVRQELDGWERRTGRRARLQGFSTHYSVSILDGRSTVPSQRIRDLSWLLAYILPAPVMLLSTNRQSTGVGVRPRPRRIEVTADFPPDPARLAATAAIIGGIVVGVSNWGALDVQSLAAHAVPVVKGFRPIRHTSRKGWLAHAECYPLNPFTCAPGAPIWETTLGRLSVRQMARKVFAAFRNPIRRLADPLSYRVATELLSGRSRSWLEDERRPAAYDDVGRRSIVPPPFTALGRSRYERALLHAIARRPLRLRDEWWTPVSVRGWSRVVFRRERDDACLVLPLDTLVAHLDRWG